MTFAVQPARPEDASVIAAVHTESWAETYPGLIPHEFLSRMTDEAARERRRATWAQTIGLSGQPVFVAEQAGEVVGLTSGGPPHDHPEVSAELYTLYSLRRVQGQGMGRQLLLTLARELHAGGANSLALWVLDLNPAREWYVRQGARPAGEKTVAVPGGELRERRMVWDDLGALVRD
ncbi:GNAT family N-acetyltransferase [Deinococcus deserti]|uniref:Putative acetyltransferase n=1 Tax=Deinococcus deserti (strain DSM 17065 / CIP 109153 / LMG 22923 / VCD115) TaxID=546414 RepID=C1D049_DEIDV|nr:GNAT family N-acetyltransferase [Deinococcus deserti]ACO47318.1 putative acetyltransferase [Deinococcus deserti VCD115]